MIKVNFTYKSESIVEFSISGHADAKKSTNDYYDLVCAAVSGIVFGILNSLDDKKSKIIIKDNFVSIIVNDIENEDNQLILNVLRKSLETVEKKGKGNIKIFIDRG